MDEVRSSNQVPISLLPYLTQYENYPSLCPFLLYIIWGKERRQTFQIQYSSNQHIRSKKERRKEAQRLAATVEGQCAGTEGEAPLLAVWLRRLCKKRERDIRFLPLIYEYHSSLYFHKITTWPLNFSKFLNLHQTSSVAYVESNPNRKIQALSPIKGGLGLDWGFTNLAQLKIELMYIYTY